MPSPIRMGVVGAGYFGRFHAEKVARSADATLVAVADVDAARAAAVAEPLGARGIADYRELFGQVDAVSIAAPTREHYRIARGFLEHGADVLVEKPITDDLATATALVELARANDRILQVGHLERFSGVVEALRRYLDRPLYIESIRIGPFKSRGTDVNVILDVMIHDLDLILTLVNAPIVSVDAAGASVFSPSEDIANVRIHFADACIANVVASRISLKSERRLRVFQANRYITADLDRREITVASAPPGTDPTSLLESLDFVRETYSTGDALEKQLAAFLVAVRERSEPVVTGEDGRAALAAALEINDKLRQHARRVAAATAAAAEPRRGAAG